MTTASFDPHRLARGRVESRIGPIDYDAYLPHRYDPDLRYPTLYLLHGRGDSLESWRHTLDDLDDLTARGAIPPVIAILPDAPWSERAGYYVDSLFTGDPFAGDGTRPPGEGFGATGHGLRPAGAAIETALVRDLVPHIDREFRTPVTRESRAVGGYSMGGAGALRFVTQHPDVFAEGIVLSPALYDPLPPAESSARDFGAFGVGDNPFVEDRYRELAYPRALAAIEVSTPVHLFIGAGDNEPTPSDPSEPQSNLAIEAERIHGRASQALGVTSTLHVIEGGHDWATWRQLFRLALEDLGARW